MKISVKQLDSFEFGAKRRHLLGEFTLSTKLVKFTTLHLEKSVLTLAEGSTLELEAKYIPENSSFSLFIRLNNEPVFNGSFQYLGIPAAFEWRASEKIILSFGIEE